MQVSTVLLHQCGAYFFPEWGLKRQGIRGLTSLITAGKGAHVRETDSWHKALKNTHRWTHVKLEAFFLFYWQVPFLDVSNLSLSKCIVQGERYREHQLSLWGAFLYHLIEAIINAYLRQEAPVFLLQKLLHHTVLQISLSPHPPGLFYQPLLVLPGRGSTQINWVLAGKLPHFPPVPPCSSCFPDSLWKDCIGNKQSRLITELLLNYSLQHSVAKSVPVPWRGDNAPLWSSTAPRGLWICSHFIGIILLPGQARAHLTQLLPRNTHKDKDRNNCCELLAQSTDSLDKSCFSFLSAL